MSTILFPNLVRHQKNRTSDLLNCFVQKHPEFLLDEVGQRVYREASVSVSPFPTVTLVITRVGSFYQGALMFEEGVFSTNEYNTPEQVLEELADIYRDQVLSVVCPGEYQDMEQHNA